jgi:hypothetical protein
MECDKDIKEVDRLEREIPLQTKRICGVLHVRSLCITCGSRSWISAVKMKPSKFKIRAKCPECDEIGHVTKKHGKLNYVMRSESEYNGPVLDVNAMGDNHDQFET